MHVLMLLALLHVDKLCRVSLKHVDVSASTVNKSTQSSQRLPQLHFSFWSWTPGSTAVHKPAKTHIHKLGTQVTMEQRPWASP